MHQKNSLIGILFYATILIFLHSNEVQGEDNKRNLKKKYSLEDLQDYPASLGFGEFPLDPFNIPPPPPPPPIPPMLPEFLPGDDENSEETEISQQSSPEYIKKQVVVTTAAVPTCLEGFLLVGETCTRIDQKPIKLGCMEGWKYEDGGCTGAEVTTANKLCDDDFEFVGEECVKTKFAPHQISCPDGFQLLDDGCQRKIFSKPDVKCEEGYTMEHDRCIKQEEVEPELKCSGEYAKQGNFCVEESNKDSFLSCNSSGFSLIGGKCSKISSQDIINTCPNGYSMRDDSCIKRMTIPANVSCRFGKLKGSQCVLYTETEPSKQCPNNYILSASSDSTFECIKKEIVSPRALCTDGTHYNPKTGKCHYSKKHEKHSVAIDIKQDCPVGFVWGDGGVMCEKVSKRQPDLVCKAGSVADKGLNKCVLEEATPPEKNCSIGYTLSADGHMCESLDIKGYLSECPEGYTFDELAAACTKILHEEAVRKCDDGYHLALENQCKKVEAVIPEKVCPSGYLLKNSHKKKKEQFICEGNFSKPISYECPKPFKIEYNNLSTSNKHSKPICVSFEKLLPDIHCPVNFVQNTDNPPKCQLRETRKRRLACPEDFKFVGDQCVKVLHDKAVTMCPVGYALAESVCVMQVYSPIIPECPKGYKFDKLVGECYKVVESYDFLNRGVPSQLPASSHPKEALLSLEDETTSTTTAAPATEALLPEETLEPLPPSNVQIVQQPVPIPSPVVYLPSQVAMPAPPPPSPMPIPMPYPVPIQEPKPKSSVSFKGKKK